MSCIIPRETEDMMYTNHMQTSQYISNPNQQSTPSPPTTTSTIDSYTTNNNTINNQLLHQQQHQQSTPTPPPTTPSIINYKRMEVNCIYVYVDIEEYTVTHSLERAFFIMFFTTTGTLL